jgi:hypothetical protein
MKMLKYKKNIFFIWSDWKKNHFVGIYLCFVTILHSDYYFLFFVLFNIKVTRHPFIRVNIQHVDLYPKETVNTNEKKSLTITFMSK